MMGLHLGCQLLQDKYLGRERTVSDTKAIMYQLDVATCMLSYPGIFNVVCGQARHMTMPRKAHVQALMTLMKYLVSMENRGLLLSPNEKWRTDYKFKVHGRLDSDFVTNPNDHQSISSGRVFVNGVLLAFHSVTEVCDIVCD